MKKIRFIAFSVDLVTDGIDEEFEIYGMIPKPEIIGETVEYVNDVIEKKINVRMGYEIKFPPYSTNSTTEPNTETIMAKLLTIMRKKYVHIASAASAGSYPRWQDNTNFPFTNLNTSFYGTPVFCDSFSVTEAWEQGEEIIELSLKEKAIR